MQLLCFVFRKWWYPGELFLSNYVHLCINWNNAVHNLENSFQNMTWSELGKRDSFLLSCQTVMKKPFSKEKRSTNTTYCTCLSEYLMLSSSCLRCGKDEAGRMEPQGKGAPITRKKWLVGSTKKQIIKWQVTYIVKYNSCHRIREY